MAKIEGVIILEPHRAIRDTHGARRSFFTLPEPTAADRVAQFAQGVRRHALQEAFAARAADVHAPPSEPANLLGVDRREFAEAASGVTGRIAGFCLSADDLERAITRVGEYLKGDQGLTPHSISVGLRAKLAPLFRDLAAYEAGAVNTLELTPEQARRFDNDAFLDNYLKAISAGSAVLNPEWSFNWTRLNAVRSVVAASVLGKFEDLCALATPAHAERLRELAPSPAAQHQLLAGLAAAMSSNPAQFSGDSESVMVRFGKLVLSFEATPSDGYRFAYHQSA